MDILAMDWIGAVIPGIIVGLIFGFILQRGRFCFNSAIRDPLLLKDFKLLKGVALAICVEMIGFAFLVFNNPAILAMRPLALVAQIIGGTVFGIGMVLAAGCASGTTYRVGEGMIGSLIALLGLTFGVYMVKPGGVLNQTKTDLVANTGGSSVSNIGGDFAWIIMLIVGIVGLGYFVWKDILPAVKEMKEKKIEINLVDAIFKNPWKWHVTGLVLGVLAIISLAVGNLLGITGHWWKIGMHFTNSDSLTLGAWMVVSMVIGAFIAAKVAGEFKLRVPKDGMTVIKQLIGGIMMGVGAAFAGGCNIGNMLSGVAILSVGSIVTTVFIFVGCWLATYLLFMRE
ncbi:MAG: YeeE/YedE family protein [Promethearchaeota archaeon]